MKHILIAIFLIFNTVILDSQVVLIIEGQEIIDTETGVSSGYNIPRSQVTNLTFRNNSLISVNSAGYMLQAGDEAPGLNNNHLDGAFITGNKFIWNGTDTESWTHSLFTGYNKNVTIKYNYLLNTPNGIQRKSDGMTDETGVIAYNIVNNPKLGVVVKGMNGVRIYNNTLYCEKTPGQTGRGLIDIHANTDNGLNAPSTGTSIFNNIFYTRYETYCINVMDQESLVDFTSDYNLFYCETGSPKFNAGGDVKTFEEWQALGYDVHSVVMNPEFQDLIDFTPTERLNYGTDLGSDYSEGLATDAFWSNVSPRTVTQNGTWQVGARIFGEIISDTVELPLDEIIIYPNPASSFFYVLQTVESSVYESIEVFDSGGNRILYKPLKYGLNIIELPNGLSSGLYNASLDAGNLKRETKKLIIISNP